MNDVKLSFRLHYFQILFKINIYVSFSSCFFKKTHFNI